MKRHGRLALDPLVRTGVVAISPDVLITFSVKDGIGAPVAECKLLDAVAVINNVRRPVGTHGGM